MYQKMAVIACVLLLLLCGCSAAGDAPSTQAEPVYIPTEPATVETVPPDTEPEEPRSILIGEHGLHLYDGIYVLDTSEYTVDFDEVIMDINLEEMTFALRCFDGSVVRGMLEIDGHFMICSYPGGNMVFNMHYDQNRQLVLRNTGAERTGKNIVADQLMICPQTDMVPEYTFHYMEGREEEIIDNQETDSIGNYKHLYEEWFSFTAPDVDDKGEGVYYLRIYHYPMENRWGFQRASRPIDVDYQENPDGSITFSRDDEQWNFHWEDASLCFDGGSTLIADNGVSESESYYRKTEVPSGAVFRAQWCSYVYDALYILPGSNLEEAYAGIQIDTQNQLLKIQCYDGKILRGPYIYKDGDLYCEFEIPDYVGTRTAYISISPSYHALNVGNQWMLNIGPGDISSRFCFTPVQGVDYQKNPFAATETEPNDDGAT